MNDGPCENKYCLMDRREDQNRIQGLDFQNLQLRRIVEILIEPYAYREQMSFEDAMRMAKENDNENSASRDS